MRGGSDSLIFRELRRADLPTFTTVMRLGIGKLERSTGLDQNAEAMVTVMSRWSIWFLLWLSRLIGRPFVRVYIAVDGPRVVGTGTVFMLSRAGYVGGMATEVEYPRCGIASRILDLLQAEAARRGRDWLVLDVESENDTAIRVYQRAGYRAVGRFAWFTRPGLLRPSPRSRREPGPHRNGSSRKSSPSSTRAATPTTAQLCPRPRGCSRTTKSSFGGSGASTKPGFIGRPGTPSASFGPTMFRGPKWESTFRWSVRPTQTSNRSFDPSTRPPSGFERAPPEDASRSSPSRRARSVPASRVWVSPRSSRRR